MAKKKMTKAERALAEQKESYDWIQSIISALIICIVLFLFLFRIMDVSGSSMVPMLVSNLFYKPKPGDVVIFKTDDYDPDKALVKRVIATEGMVVNIDFDEGVVYVNDQPIQEDYIAEITRIKEDFMGPWTVPKGCVFVMGDNRNKSTDSRDKRIGNVDEREIIGRAYAVIYPLSEWKWIK